MWAYIKARAQQLGSHPWKPSSTRAVRRVKCSKPGNGTASPPVISVRTACGTAASQLAGNRAARPTGTMVAKRDGGTITEKIERLEALRDGGKIVAPSHVPTVAE